MSTMSLSDPSSLIALFIGIFLGAVVKGATGVGLPIIAIPTIAMFYDVRIAVAILVIPNFFTNIWQIKKYRAHSLNDNFARNFAFAGIFGAGIGTVLLAYLPLVLLNITIAAVVLAYITTKLVHPEFHLDHRALRKWEVIAGTSAGILQGAIGLSSPITITFLHAGHLPRFTFIYIASVFFAGMCLIQLPLQSALGLMTGDMVILSILAFVPIIIGLPVGERIGRTMSSTAFDRGILVLLSILAIKMLLDALAFN